MAGTNKSRHYYHSSRLTQNPKLHHLLLRNIKIGLKYLDAPEIVYPGMYLFSICIYKKQLYNEFKITRLFLITDHLVIRKSLSGDVQIFVSSLQRPTGDVKIYHFTFFLSRHFNTQISDWTYTRHLFELTSRPHL